MIDLAAARAYILRIARKFFKDPEDCEDVAQEALLAAHLHQDAFRGDAAVNSWLYMITTRTSIDLIRYRRRRPVESMAFEDPETELVHEHACPVDLQTQTIAREHAGIVATAVAAMGEKHETVFWRRYADGASETQVARELGISPAAVKARGTRARLVAIAALEAA